MAQRGAKTKGTSSPSQTSGLSALIPAQTPAPSGPGMMELQKTMKDLADGFNKRFDEMQKNFQDLKEQIKEGCEKIRQEMAPVIIGLADNVEALAEKVLEIQEEQKVAQTTTNTLEERLEVQNRELLVLQYKEMEYILRLRGLKEGKEEDLKNLCAEAFAIILQIDPAEMYANIQKIYRVNSWVARQRNLPRDVLVYFEKKQLRYDVAQAAYHQGLKIQGQEVRVIKEIPIRVLRMRKDFNFLTDELKKCGLPFRWEIPAGLVVNYMGRRYRLLSVQRAQEFYYDVLKAGSSGKDAETSLIQLEDNGAVAPEKQEERPAPVGEPKEKRVTRAMAKKTEKTQRDQQMQDDLSAVGKQSEAMGGARSKILPVDTKTMCTKLYGKPDG